MAFLCLLRSFANSYFFRADRIAQILSMVPAMFMVSELFSISSCKAFYRYFNAVLYCYFLKD